VNPKGVFFIAILASACGLCAAQGKSVAMPDSLVIARDTFWDFGPPFNYYDLIQITKTDDGLSLDQVLVTPHGQACMQPATVEERTAALHKTMSELLEGRNPCAIPEKDINREIKRCKKCLVFSGVNLTMQASCDGKDRQLRMDILDRDIYDNRTPTPENTSWSMRVLSELSDPLGPGSEAKPIFQLSPAVPHPVPSTPLVNAIREGRYDNLFRKDSGVSQIVHEADKPPPPSPSVAIAAISPLYPVSPDLPKYPPIAVAARLEGMVRATFNITASGKVQNIEFQDGPRLKMLEGAVSDTMSIWSFPGLAWGNSGRVAIQFALNCHDDPK
jgi:TonB family protein